MLLKKVNSSVLPSIFDNFYRDWSSTNFSDTESSLPAVNIKENDEMFVVEVAAPGMDKKDFKIDLINDILTISSEKTQEKEDSNENYMRKEYSYLSFKRSFTLPTNVINRDKINATYKNGELKISIPKLDEAKPKPIKLIEVK